MLMRRFPQGSGYNFARQHVICFATFSSQQVRRRLQTLMPLRVFVSVRNQPTPAVRVMVTETYFASCKANFRSSIVTFRIGKVFSK